MPATDSGMGGHRPPDPGGRGEARGPEVATREDAVVADPANHPPNRGGPHQFAQDGVDSLVEFPALVTTPSDAQGGNSAATTTQTLEGRAHGDTAVEAGAAAPPLPPQRFAAAVGRGGSAKTRLSQAQPPPSDFGGRWTPHERHVPLETLAKALAPADHRSYSRPSSCPPHYCRGPVGSASGYCPQVQDRERN
ncbi:hypothetical protein PF005_g13183 [Phytophthora fragariae]|uniref:Uncharacterized protein n=1 Tax=Phytophthora fragariae TaxID=53985 RepID=A0A6A3YX00_9STRA|nr:hypothetical protein PF003_g36791 [Phytophthora fragariae]KAE8935668.1 hypothetical protein PF009_g14384 [Phytophthora fragariae]KAE9108055.1 hypothetical protein PF007_g12796 [Phytophthora fragariae]KAE9205978.1 hypothetical protein PF005_g13183 [Phytophthora fragariae]KAE9224715.1 hypothetical protein PF002_g14612 [Phytophthora fragariae]